MDHAIAVRYPEAMKCARVSTTSSPSTRAFERRIDSFAMEVQASRARVLRMTGAVEPIDERDALQRAREELQVEQEELRVAEEELREQIDELARVSERATLDRERYRQLFDDSLDGLLVTDLSGVIREANAIAAGAFGLGAHLLRGRPLPAFSSARHRDDVRTMVNAASRLPPGQYVDATIDFEPRGAPAFEASLRGGPSRSDGRLLWSPRLAAPDGDLRVSGMRVRFDGPADGGRAEADAYELLERERAIRDRFERAARAKERFLSVLSHDLRGPLNAVLGWTQLLRRESLSPVSRDQALATIERNACVQLGLIEEILDISRLTEDKMVLEFEAVDVRSIVERVVESTMPSAATKGIALVLERDGEPPWTVADARRLGQVFTNLLCNAVKFTPPGGRITVGVSCSDREIVVSVRDTGRGITADVLPHVFERYRQHEPATQGGLGLGLYIVRELVELHGGSVEAESAGVDTGATFTVKLPRHATDAPPSSRRPQAPAPALRLDHVRVLIVDDDADTREVLAAILEAHGATVGAAGDASGALALVEAFGPDVIVSDIGLKDEDGFALVQRVRRRHSGLALIALSGFSERRYVEQAFQAGFDMFLVKPVDSRTLVETITSLLSAPRV